MTTQPLPQDNSNPSNLPQPGQSPEIPNIPPATVPEQQPDSLPEPLGPDIPDWPEPTPDVPVPEHSPEIPDIPPATVPEQQPDSPPAPLGSGTPDRPDPAPDVPMLEEAPRPLSIQKNLRCSRTSEIDFIATLANVALPRPEQGCRFTHERLR